jgi:hypothetical protein
MSDSGHSTISPASGDDAGEDRCRRSLSALIDQLAVQTASDTLTITDLVAWFQDRATLALMMIFGILNILPHPPGTSVVVGLPMLYLSLAMMLDRPPWFPRIVTERGISRSLFAAVATRATPVLRRCERLLRPRLSWLSRGLASRLSGLLCLVLSVILILPVPFGNIAPAACVTLLALAIAARDGLWVLFGWALSLACVVLMSGIVVTTLYLVARVVTGLFS